MEPTKVRNVWCDQPYLRDSSNSNNETCSVDSEVVHRKTAEINLVADERGLNPFQQQDCRCACTYVAVL